MSTILLLGFSVWNSHKIFIVSGIFKQNGEKKTKGMIYCKLLLPYAFGYEAAQ